MDFSDKIEPQNQMLKYLCFVKKGYKLLGMLLLASIYFFGIGVSSRVVSTPDVGHSGKGAYFSVAKTTLFCEVPQPETSFDKVNDCPASSPNVFFAGNVGVQRPHEILFGATGRQYLRFSVNFLVRHRKADLIFPFHYFW
ncbi:hypothetical protein D2V93_12040 [Flagellimonas taeanensis]|nr:hypothetical protein D2V93_12040 [Allomuricauda taeanensis]